MSRVHRRDTAPEMLLRRALWRRGVRGWRVDAAGLPGRPDLAFRRAHVAVFVDGGFWHGHPSRFRPGQSGAYWDDKIQRNRDRDHRANQELATQGWRVLRLWDFEVVRDPDQAARRVETLLTT
jgi:DNA mismatch endonuclease (patch repair protein)